MLKNNKKQKVISITLFNAENQITNLPVELCPINKIKNSLFFIQISIL